MLTKSGTRWTLNGIAAEGGSKAKRSFACASCAPCSRVAFEPSSAGPASVPERALIRRQKVQTKLWNGCRELCQRLLVAVEPRPHITDGWQTTDHVAYGKHSCFVAVDIVVVVVVPSPWSTSRRISTTRK